ncbi:hypothetical protein ACCI51_10075 [Microbulbifer echini]|uniref:Uncharacterized protein n=1 Tax=Microbulbifer echini TaxID=1529067 RepID=A0ABV4NNG7_9GAMM
MINTCLISQSKELEAFTRNYILESGNETSIKHFERISTVRVFKNRQGDMIGGYSLNTRLPIRYFEDIPKTTILPSFVTQSINVIETGGLWINREVNQFYRGVILLYSLWDIHQSKKKYIVSGAKHPKIAKIQSLVFPHKLYEGPVKSAQYACIFYAKRGYLPTQALIIISKYWIIEPLKSLTFHCKNIMKKPIKNTENNLKN